MVSQIQNDNQLYRRKRMQTYLSHLFSATTDIIIPNIRQIGLLIFSLNRVPFGVYDGILSDDTVFCWIGLDDFELHSSHTSSDEEGVTFSDGSVSSVMWGNVSISILDWVLSMLC